MNGRAPLDGKVPAVAGEVSEDGSERGVGERAVAVLTGPRRGVVLFLLLLVLFGATSTWRAGGINDVQASSATAWLIANHGTLDFRVADLEDVPWSREGPDGQVYTNRFPGTYLPAVPAYLLAPRGDPAGEPDNVPMLPAALTAAALVAGALVVLHEVMRDELGARRGLAVTLVAGLGTSVWTVAADALWPHTAGVLLLALAMRALQRERHLLAGAWVGLAITVRPTHAFLALGLGVVLAIVHRQWRRLVQIGLPSLAGAALLSGYTRLMFGSWLPTAGYDQGRVDAIVGLAAAKTGPFTWQDQIAGTLFDPYHGVFPYSPFLLICVVYVVAGWRRTPWWARALTLGGMLYWVVQLRGNAWPGGYNFFGYRYPIEPLWVSSVLFGHAWFEAMKDVWARRIGIVLLTIALTLTTLGAAMFGSRWEPDRPCYEARRLSWMRERC